MLNRRTILKGVSAGAGGILFSPFLQKLSAQVDGNAAPPKRVIFFLFDNGFAEAGAQPVDVPLGTPTVQQLPLADLKLPSDIEPFAPFRDRLTIVQGLRGYHLSPAHGGGFGALSGLTSSDKIGATVGESIDAAAARIHPSAIPLLVLGVAAGSTFNTAFVSSGWGPNRPIAAQCKPETAYESLFGRIGATQNDFAKRKNLLDFVAGDVRRLRAEIAGPERDQLENHLEAIESLARRDQQLATKFDSGALAAAAPQLPEKPAQKMTEIVALQCELATAALTAGITNTVTITSGLCTLGTNYTGLSDVASHALGHNESDPQIKDKTGHEIVAMYRRYLATQAAKMLAKLATVKEGNGTMLDNTLLVFTSDSANRQHTAGENWPFVLVGNLGGGLKAGQFLSYPLEFKNLKQTPYENYAIAPKSNPAVNALYCTILHALGRPRDTFNYVATSKESPALYGPLSELLA
jgi:hypothetical protein